MTMTTMIMMMMKKKKKKKKMMMMILLALRTTIKLLPIIASDTNCDYDDCNDAIYDHLSQKLQRIMSPGHFKKRNNHWDGKECTCKTCS